MAPPLPSDLAETHRDAILAAAAAQVGGVPADFTLLPEESFASEEEADAYAFILLHAQGMVTVYAAVEDGALARVRVARL